MRTTVAIDDELLMAAKKRALTLGLTLGEYIERALRTMPGEDGGRRERLPLPVFHGGTGVAPGVDLNSNRALQEFLDEGLPLDKLR